MKKYEIDKLQFEFDSLEPWMDAKTVEIHHDKHHQTYCDKLNAAVEKHPELFEMNAEDLLRDLDEIPEDIRTAVKNNGGGFVNHNFFWSILGRDKKFGGKVAKEIEKTFGSFDNFKKQFSETALNRFASGWAWLVMNDKKLGIINTANQDSPLSEGKIPLLTIDVWEHAYYLKYQNRRAEYIEAFWNIINWDAVNKKFDAALKGK